MAPRSRQLAAVMFTDIEGYTALMHVNESLAQMWRTRHRQAFHETHAIYNGQIIQYFGDGTLSVFESALNAVKCAVDIQQMLRKNEPQVPLRIGLHLGEIVWDGEDIFGDGVNIASRVESFSVAGAVLLSDRLYEQISNHAIPCRSMGVFHLKNVSRAVELFAVEEDSLVIPEKAQMAGKGSIVHPLSLNNLPKLTNSFIGREAELADLPELIRRNRLVTITGTGGTGKTRLSIRVAEAIQSAFKDGVCWVPLASLAQSNQVAFAVAQALSIIQDTTQKIEDLLFNHLKDKNLLLLLDNFEHVTEAADLVGNLMQRCPNLHVLATSRNPLKLYGEQEYPLTPLETPDDDFDLAELEISPAVNLFCQRAKAIQPVFELNAENAVAIAGICRRLDGLPLAIELAAARIKLFSPQALLTRLTNNFELLKGSWLGQDTRHSTLRETIAWSYRLLDPNEKQLFQMMSVFAGGATLEAIEYVGEKAGFVDWDIVEGVQALIEKSLLQKEETGLLERFYMLETIRFYALEALDSYSEGLETRNAHARYYLGLAERAQPNLTGKDQVAWLSILAVEQDNFRAAISWLISSGAYPEAYKMGIALWRFWMTKSLLIEGVEQINTLLSLPYAEEEPRLKLLGALGTFYMSKTETLRALDIFGHILAIRRKQNNLPGLASALNAVGFLTIQSGQISEGLLLCQEALELYLLIGDREGEAASYLNMGWAFIHNGHLYEGVHYFESCLRIRRELKDFRRIGHSLAYFAVAQLQLGDFSEALAMVKESKKLLSSAGDETIQSWANIVNALIYWVLDDQNAFEEALNIIEQQREKNAEIKYIFGWNSLFKAILSLSQEQIETADNHMTEGLRNFTDLGMGGDFFKHFWQLANLKYKQFQKAYILAQERIDDNFQNENTYYLLHNLEVIGIVLAKWGAFDKATVLLARAFSLREAEKIVAPPWFKFQLDETLDLLKRQLKDQNFEELWIKGSAMSLEEAVKMALEKSP